MTSLPMPPVLPEPSLAGLGMNAAAAADAIGAFGVAHGIEEEQHLLRAFRTFAETAGSLERFYCLLRAEVAGLRQALQESRAGLERSLDENRSMRMHLDRILESLPCGVVVVSSSGEISHLNPEGKRLLGLEDNAALGLADDLRGELRELLLAARRQGGERERQVFASPGPGRWLAVRQAALAADASGSSVFILQDVSERKRLEQEQDRHRRQQALAEMSAVLAHEVRNPLGSLELFASLLAEADLGSECQEWIGHLQHGLRTLTATVNNVLHFHGAPPPQRTLIDLGQLLVWAMSFLGPLARLSQVKLILGNGLHGVFFAGDRHQLEQVLLNLSLNALRVMPDGGCLELAGERQQDRIDGPGFATLTVSDTGPGIAPENLPEIFKAGFSTRAGSPGLGLAVCRKIVEHHGGTIQVASRAPSGASFTVRLPLATPMAAVRSRERETAS
jgi:two-component system, sensor histidine kinase FlrB